MKGGRRARALFLVLATYVFLQLAWWANLLISSAATLFETRTAFNTSPDVLAAAIEDWEKTVLMVAAEGVIFALLFMFGLSWIWRVMRADNYILARERNFVMAVTHELKTPIASTRLAIDTLKRLDLKGADRDEMLDVARSGTLRLERRVEDILQATRLNLPDALVRNPFDIKEFVEDTVSTFVHLHPEASISVRLIGDSVLLLQGDEEMWRLCLINLLENAIKYSPKQATVEVILDTTTTKPSLSVIDHGPGIVPEQRKKVFEAFYRLSRDKDIEGTGLGLHLVYRIVKMHGAEIHITSTSGGGATFVIDLPAN
ncbi:MAG: HAMP domain-containing sensor histidine kinase [Flavobacteriales bacterium]|nr:HAMP domain-containing sensor histidine kinase [Flavobacteriales bacterium]